MWLAVASDDVDRARAAMDEHWMSALSEDERAALAKIGTDLEEDGAECPACGSAFDPEEGRCPDCGLNFGSGD